ncbi:fungal hydrophobin-domain-containing protein [Earliella scabrosa]|nr:fungal hydrophobin-domain-containing protein [Earliella scabrosa]
MTDTSSLAHLAPAASAPHDEPASSFSHLPSTMFSRLAVFSALAFAAGALAVPAPSGSCNTGPVQCCNSLEEADSAAGSAILSLIGIAVQDVTAKVGLGCSPISVIGAGTGSACSAQPVCCQNNSVGGLISIGCVPIML